MGTETVQLITVLISILVPQYLEKGNFISLQEMSQSRGSDSMKRDLSLKVLKEKSKFVSLRLTIITSKLF